MFIIWGEKRTRKKWGIVAEFCPYCRELRPMKLIRIGLVSHLYGISIGSGKEIRHEATCLECKGTIETNLTDYPMIAKSNDRDFQRLLMTTNPAILETRRERFELENLVRTNPGKIDPEVRAQLIREPFSKVVTFAEETLSGSTQLDRHFALAFFGTILAMIAVIALVIQLGLKQAEWFGWSIVAIAVTGFVVSIYYLITANRRAVRRIYAPLIKRALSPLRPSREEIETAMEAYSACAVAKHIRPEDVIEANPSMLKMSGV